jgi:hypothetical protein
MLRFSTICCSPSSPVVGTTKGFRIFPGRMRWTNWKSYASGFSKSAILSFSKYSSEPWLILVDRVLFSINETLSSVRALVCQHLLRSESDFKRL